MKYVNPLLDLSGLPRFEEIEAHHVEPALDEVLATNREQISALESHADIADWTSFARPLEDLDERLQRVWSPVSHLNAVVDSDALRQAYEACLAKVSAYETEMGQNQALFKGFQRLQETGEGAGTARRRVISNALRDFRLSGVELDESSRAKFAVLAEELALLENRFEQNVLDATDDWHLDVVDASDLAGVPTSVCEMAAATAREAGQGGWRFTLKAPSYVPFMKFAKNRSLRERMYHAYVTRASEMGPGEGRWDNSEVMVNILRLRRQMASLLGYDNFAEYAMETRMATSVAEVDQFLSDLVARARGYAEDELQALVIFAEETDEVCDVQAWDLAFYAERLREVHFALSQETLRPYFPLPRVLKGLFEVVHRLFSIRVEPVASPQLWHESVTFYDILDVTGAQRGSFYLDLFARANKRSGAWMADAIDRRRLADGGVQIPVAFLVCNFTPPVDDQPTLLTHEEVLTLFHEFGHGLHHLLTQVDEPAVAGINGVPWDAVELPSQFLENWCWQREALDLIAAHHESGDPLPGDLFKRLSAARCFQSARAMLRQLEFSIFDLHLHSRFDPDGEQTIQHVLDDVRASLSVAESPTYNRFQHAFSHIFAGGYAAGYYSYLWAEVLSADAFGAFEESGIFDSATGQAFLSEVLEKGGVESPLDLFAAFRGRAPGIDAVLHQSGLA